MHYKKTVSLFLGLSVAILCGCPGDKPPVWKDVSSPIKAALGIPDNQTIFVGSFSPPIGTIFCSKVLDPKAPVQPESCLKSDPTDWFDPAVSDADRKAVLGGIFKTENPMGSFKISRKLTSDVNVNASLPLIGKIFTASGSVDVGKTSTVTISGDTAVREVIAWKPLKDAANANKFTDSTQKLLLSIGDGDYAVVVSDYIVTNLQATIEVDPKLDVNAKGSLPTAIANLGKGTSAGFKVTRNGTSSFTVSVDRAVLASIIDIPAGNVLQSEGPETTAALTGKPTNTESVNLLVKAQMARKMAK